MIVRGIGTEIENKKEKDNWEMCVLFVCVILFKSER